MSEQKGFFGKYRRLIWLCVILAAMIYFVAGHAGVVLNVLLVGVGFGAVIMIHEFGHFLFAKISGIKVEVFSIGFPPVLAGIIRTEQGYRVRILPKFFPAADGSEDGGGLSFTFGKGGEAGETEYQIGMVPMGGLVKMLGQEDVGTIKSSDDPRSYPNKSVGARMSVIAAGVTFNVISAVIIFMTVFLVGIKLTAPVVGGVLAGSPAARAGMLAGDEIIEIAGQSKDLDFSSIRMAAALSDEGEEVLIKVRHEDGSIEEFSIAPEEMAGADMRVFGIEVPMSLTVAEVSDANALFEETGLLPGDVIRAIDGREVGSYWELADAVRNSFSGVVTVTARRSDGETVETEIGLGMGFASGYDVNSESDLSHIYSMVPRLRVTLVSEQVRTVKGRKSLEVGGIIISPQVTTVEGGVSLEVGDIIVSIGGVANPTYKEMREVTEEHNGKELTIEVLRGDAEEHLALVVEPKRRAGSDRVMIGIGVALDAERAVVAKTISVEGLEALAIPRGAEITSIGGVKVSNFYEIAGQLKRGSGRRVNIAYRVGDGAKGGIAVEVVEAEKFITAEPVLMEFVALRILERLYKSDGPFGAIGMGYRKTMMFIGQTYVTLRRLVSGLVSTKDLMGPVGIITFSYRIVAEQPIIYYVYFLGLISACIAVFNFLPLPPLDGGHMVLLAVEKIKGSALSERVQVAVAYAGWVLIGSFFLYVTFNDIIKGIFG